jgi:hypothetical protein
MTKYPRDMVGYGAAPPQVQWPGGAHIASQIVLNYEEGAENNILHGAATCEAFLSEIIGALPLPGQRPGAVSPLSCRAEACHFYIALTSFWRVIWIMKR